MDSGNKSVVISQITDFFKNSFYGRYSFKAAH